MIETFEKEKNDLMPRTITSVDGCQTITTNCNTYQPRINQIVKIEAKDDKGNVVFSIEGGDITISIEKERLGYHYF